MTFVLMYNTSLPKYRPLSSTPKAAYLPVTSYIFLTSETRQLNNQLVYLSTRPLVHYNNIIMYMPIHIPHPQSKPPPIKTI